MPRPNMPEGEAKNGALSIRLKEPDLARLIELSESLGVSKGSLAAKLIINGLAAVDSENNKDTIAQLQALQKTRVEKLGEIGLAEILEY